jgi:hypothetical protein
MPPQLSQIHKYAIVELSAGHWRTAIQPATCLQ